MGKKIIKARAQGYPDLTISSPLNEPLEVRKAIAEAKKADQLIEFATMRTWEVYQQNRFGTGGSPGNSPIVEALSLAHSELANAREALGNAVHTLEKTLKLAGV